MASERIDVMIDSCVFFKMIDYNNHIEKYGRESLGDFINSRIKMLKKKEEKLTESFGEDFNKKFANLSFDEKLEKYKEYVNNREAKLISEIQLKRHLSVGEVVAHVNGDEVVYRKEPNIPQAKRDKSALDADRMQAELNSLTKFSEVEKEMNAYRLLRESINDGIIFQGAVEGKYRLCVPYISYEEIHEHTKEKKSDAGWATWSKSEVESLARNFTIFIRAKKDVREEIASLAREYRTANDEVADTKPMAEDINSVGIFGDSKIAAIANIAGMILVTNNGKDFIFDKSIKTNNENIRNHIDGVNASHDFTTDARVYSAEEFITGLYSVPEKQSNFTLTERESKKMAFDYEIEIS